MSQATYVILFTSTIPVSLLLLLTAVYDLKKITMSPVEHAKTRVILFLATMLITISTSALYSKVN